jgi:hypothetical protein
VKQFAIVCVLVLGCGFAFSRSQSADTPVPELHPLLDRYALEEREVPLIRARPRITRSSSALRTTFLPRRSGTCQPLSRDM